MVSFASVVATLRSNHRPTAMQPDRATPKEVALFHTLKVAYWHICTFVYLLLARRT